LESKGSLQRLELSDSDFEIAKNEVVRFERFAMALATDFFLFDFAGKWRDDLGNRGIVRHSRRVYTGWLAVAVGTNIADRPPRGSAH
jgi:hypothetical protein